MGDITNISQQPYSCNSVISYICIHIIHISYIIHIRNYVYIIHICSQLDQWFVHGLLGTPWMASLSEKPVFFFTGHPRWAIFVKDCNHHIDSTCIHGPCKQLSQSQYHPFLYEISASFCRGQHSSYDSFGNQPIKIWLAQDLRQLAERVGAVESGRPSSAVRWIGIPSSERGASNSNV